jgi:hypothetical protein
LIFSILLTSKHQIDIPKWEYLYCQDEQQTAYDQFSFHFQQKRLN